MRRVLIGLFAVGVLCPSAFAQRAGASPVLFDRLVGRWELSGVIDGQQTVHDVDADLVLNGGYVRLHEVSREKNADGTPAYEAIVFISVDQKTGVYSLLWLDTTSNAGLTGSGIGHGKPVGNAIPFLINPGTPNAFHTTFTYDPAKDTWQWRMDGEANGTLHPFARLTLRRRR